MARSTLSPRYASHFFALSQSPAILGGALGSQVPLTGNDSDNQRMPLHLDPPDRQRNPSRLNRDSSCFLVPSHRRGKLFHPSRHSRYRPRGPAQQCSTRRAVPSGQQHHLGACRFCLSRHRLPVCPVCSVCPVGLRLGHHTGAQDALQGFSQQDGRFQRQPCRSVRSRCLPLVKEKGGVLGNECFSGLRRTLSTALLARARDLSIARDRWDRACEVIPDFFILYGASSRYNFPSNCELQ